MPLLTNMPLLRFFGDRRPADLDREIEEIIQVLEQHDTVVRGDMLRDAFRFAREVHAPQKRMDGQPYIVHPVAVARTCAEHWMTDAGVMAALLHDTIEDADKSLALTEEMLARRFGPDVAHLVAGVTKLKKDLAEKGLDPRVETLKKLLHATASEDLRIVILKIFDRCENVKTLGVFREDKRMRIGEETMRFYVPVADRLGFYGAARQMEDAVFMALQPKEHARIAEWVEAERKRKAPEMAKQIEGVKRELADMGIDAVDRFQARGLFSIHRLAQQPDGSVDVAGLQDVPVFDLCFIVPDVDACFRVLNVVHRRFRYHAESVRDFINNPKINGYQSLHTIVRGPDASRITVISRTSDMEWRNRFGVIGDLRSGRAHEGAFLHDLVESFDIINGAELLDLTGRLFFAEIDVTTPAGHGVKLPQGATALDFAYHIHTSLGDRAAGAIIAGRPRKLGTRLRSGQKVEIVKAKEPQVSPAWFGWVKTDKAALAIRKYLGKAERKAIAEEPERFAGYVRQKLGVSVKAGGQELQRLGIALGYVAGQSLGRDLLSGLLPYDIAICHLVPFLQPRDLKKVLKALARERIVTEAEAADLSSMPGDELAQVIHERLEKHAMAAIPPCEHVDVAGARFPVPVHFAQCCRPVYGEPVTGFASRERGVTIHRETCNNVSTARKYDSIHLVDARWKLNPSTRRFFMRVEGADRKNLLHDLTHVLSEYRVNVIELNIRAFSGDRFVGTILLELSELMDIDVLVAKFNAVRSLQVMDTQRLP